MAKELPIAFLERLKEIIPSEHYESVVRTFSLERPVTVRANTLKPSHTLQEVDGLRIVNGVDHAYTWTDKKREELRDSPPIAEGFLYQQGLSSMFVVQVLSPQPKERALDLCAAPGSKTSYMAALMNNEGELIAVDAIKNRLYKLNAVLKTLGVWNTKVKLMDGRRVRDEDLFDKILVDAPCSSEGRFSTHEPKTFAYWSERKIKEMAHKQRGLLLNAARLLKNDGTLVYSTCTFAPEENEAIVDWLLKKTHGVFTVEPIDLPPQMRNYPPIKIWKDKIFNPDIKNCLRVLPDAQFEGFFIAKIKRRAH